MLIRPSGKFTLPERRCARCGSIHIQLDVLSLGNLWRFPFAMLVSLVVRPPIGVKMRCSDCDYRKVYSYK